MTQASWPETQREHVTTCWQQSRHKRSAGRITQQWGTKSKDHEKITVNIKSYERNINKQIHD